MQNTHTIKDKTKFIPVTSYNISNEPTKKRKGRTYGISKLVVEQNY